MPLEKSIGKIILCAALGFVFAGHLHGQTPPILLEQPFSDSPSYLSRWDPQNNVLIFYRDVKESSASAGRPYAGGVRPGQAVYALKDFPEARGFDVWSVSGAPGGGVILAGVLQIDGIRVRQLILTYDQSATLRKIWEIYPYHYHQIASDGSSNLYAFGHREDRGDGTNEPDYPLLTKYSPNGDLIWQSAFRSWFPYETDVVATNASTGEHNLFIGRSALWLFVATTRELFEFSLDTGRLVSRRSMTIVLEELGSGTHRGEITGMAEAEDGTFLAQVRLWPRQPKTKPMTTVMARIAADLASCVLWPTKAGLPHQGIFLGIDSRDRALFLSGTVRGRPVLRTLAR